MTSKDILQESYSALVSNKSRSLLTMLGIIIGIAAVIATLAIGEGSQQSIQSSIQALGSNLITISPGAAKGAGVTVSSGQGSAKTLTLADEKVLASKLTKISGIDPEVTGRYQIVANSTNTNISVVGTTTAYQSNRSITISSGAFFSDTQNTNKSKVVVIGPTVMTDLFGATAQAADVVGQTVKISGNIFTIIGVTVSKGGSGFNNPDDMAYVPISTAQQYLSGATSISSISISADSSSDMVDVQTQATALMLQQHNITDPTLADFTVLNQSDIVSSASSILQTLTILLASVAGISLIVGGIGIMNMMLTTVTERTREIGLRKAIGAKRSDINTQFLTEAVILTFTGGIIGVIIGAGTSWIMSKFFAYAMSVTWTSIFLSFGVAASIGIIFGYYPARRASRMSPIEALRFE
jgi:putative ABC transport system permease protein